MARKKKEPPMPDTPAPQKQSAPPRGAHEGLCPFPADLPPDVLQVVLAALRGNAPDPKTAFHYTWHVVGFAGGKWDVHPNAAEGRGLLTREEAARELEKALRPLAGDTPGARAAAVPWGVILPVLMQLMQELLAKWLTP